MEEKNPETRRRRGWIVGAAVLIIACMCLAAVASVALLLSGLDGFDWNPFSRRQEATIEEAFSLGSAPEVEIVDFVGSISVRADDGETVRVSALKRARSRSLLSRITVEMKEGANSLVIRTKKPAGLSNASVQLELLVPRGTALQARTGAGAISVEGLEGQVRVDTGAGSIDLLDLDGEVDAHSGSGGIEAQNLVSGIEADSGAGSIRLHDVQGAIDAHTGTGGIRVQGASGNVRLDTGSGSIEYQGEPRGDCDFRTGSGGITLALPDDLGLRLELDTGSGAIDLGGFDVQGRITRREVEGLIGDGQDASIHAHTGAGSIDLVRD